MINFIKKLIKHDSFKFKEFSRKQKQILTWWMDDSLVKNKNGIIADGAIRSGKTLSMALSFIFWSMHCFNGKNFGMCGKSVGTFRRNVWFWLKIVLITRKYKINEIRTQNFISIQKGNVCNYYYIFGGKDERSQDYIQGITLAGVLFDEVALMPQSFINQATGRCSVEGSKFWFNCNPEGTLHFFKINWIDKCNDKNILYLHFDMEDNPSLSTEMKNRYRTTYTGVFFKRYILGLWVAAEGIIYDMFNDDLLFDDDDTTSPDLNLWYKRYYAIDYGTNNPCVFIEIIEQNNKYWVMQEYYYDSKKTGRQKTDEMYVNDLINFINNKRYTTIICDPSAASFKISARLKGLRLLDADNDVIDGIRLVSSLFNLKLLKIHKNCINGQKELSSYIWDDKSAQRGKEQPFKENDHFCDALRYFCKTIIKYITNLKKIA